ncbi:MAG: GAF domain-containing protein [Bacteroidales bacterium]|nr:GAF domain-containing protein [Bacteroidales bacterium]MBN2697394.1 GAF domain-containing protein [Bacteroidales bacterium]
MDERKKEGRYRRIYSQLEDLLKKSSDPLARMATICAVLHHKMDYFFWTGFYLLKDDALVVGPYQGPVACQVLEKNRGVCWSCVNRREPLIVPDVHQFPGHIACDARSQSEITIPVYNAAGDLVAVFDVDAREKDQFSNTDREHLEKILRLLYHDL